MTARRLFCLQLAVVTVVLAIPGSAGALPTQNAPNPGPAGGGQHAAPSAPKAKQTGNGNCSAGALALNTVNPFSHCNLGSQAANGLGQLPGDIAGAAGSVAKGLAGDVMDQVTAWMVQAAQAVDGDVMNAATATSTPELSAPWYQQEFAYLAFFGAALAGLVALLGILSASVRGDPSALGEIFYGILRAGLVTAMVISLTLLALKVADGISGEVVHHMPRQFFQTLASAWGAKGWGGLASSGLAFVTALVEVAVAVLLWIELLFRDAAIYVAVLFFPFTLAMAVWPRLSGAHSKLVRTLGIFVAFKPVALIVMMTGANLLLGGISFYGGVGQSVGTILAGLAVLAMAAFAPWALMHLAGMDAGVMGSSAARRRGASSGRGAADGPSSGEALGGELFAGAVTYGGGAAAARLGGAGDGKRSGNLAGAASVDGSPAGAGGGDVGGGSGGRILPGTVAAAAGWLPAGWQTAQSIAARGQSLADHSAARVHTASGHGGTQPPLGSTGSARTGGGPPSRGGGGPPSPRAIDDLPPPDTGAGGPPPGGAPTGPDEGGGGGSTGPSGGAATAGAEPPLAAPASYEPVAPPAADQPFKPRREES